VQLPAQSDDQPHASPKAALDGRFMSPAAGGDAGGVERSRSSRGAHRCAEMLVGFIGDAVIAVPPREGSSSEIEVVVNAQVVWTSLKAITGAVGKYIARDCSSRRRRS
jgi:hypothetical protein